MFCLKFHTLCNLHGSCTVELDADAYLHNVMADKTADTFSTFARLVDAQVRAGNAKVRARRKVKKDTPSELPTTE